MKVIKKGAFNYCNNFYLIDFGYNNSRLEMIEKDAFSSTLIDGMSFPSKLRDLSGKSFFNVPLSVIQIAKKKSMLVIFE